jgi:hypothetical protein
MGGEQESNEQGSADLDLGILKARRARRYLMVCEHGHRPQSLATWTLVFQFRRHSPDMATWRETTSVRNPQS